MRDIGAWLAVNGEAIYATKPWLVSHEGENIRFTQSKDEKYVYAICTDESMTAIEIESVYLDDSARVFLLGTEEELAWRRDAGKTVITVPKTLKKPSEHAFVLKLELS